MVIAQKKFWNHLKFDTGNISEIKSKFIFKTTQFDKIKAGYIPDDIASRYLAYFENETLFIHSIMGGDCYYELKFNKNLNNIYCDKIYKYNKFRPEDNKEQTINFIKSFLQYSLNLGSVDEFTSHPG